MYFETLKMHKNNEEVFYAANFLYFFFHAWLFLNFTFDESRLAKNNKIKMFRKIKIKQIGESAI